MASNVYPKGIIHIMSGDVNLATADIRVMIVDTADETYNAADEYVSDITSAGIVSRATSGLASKTIGVVGTGVFDAADKLLTGVTGDGTEAVIVYVYNAADASAILLAWLDGSVTPDGGNINVAFNASGIFQL
jgi:hypothetical protein